MGWESMANALCNVGLSLGFSNFLVLPLPVTVIHLSSSFSPSSDVPAHCHSLPESSFSTKFDAWLEIYLELIADQLEAVSLIFFVPRAFVRLNTMGLLAVVFLAIGARVLLWLVVLVLLFFLFLANLGLLGFLVLALQGLRCSSDKLQSELVPLANSVYSKTVSLFSIIELRNDTELVTECAVHTRCTRRMASCVYCPCLLV